MSKRCELQKEYYQQYGNYKGNGKYSDKYVSWLENEVLALRQPPVMPSGFTLKQENAIWAIIQYLAKDQFQNPKRVYKRKDVFDLIKAEMDW